MKSFKLDIFDGHAIIYNNNDTILIDTGAPSTLHKNNMLDFMSVNYSVLNNYMGMTVEKLSGMLGKNITTLLGIDVLKNYRILFDYKNTSIEFKDNNLDLDLDLDLDGIEIPLSSFMDIPVIELTIDNQNFNFFLDSGAKLSYLREEFYSDFVSSGTRDDFYPLIGKFKTECFIINTSIRNENFKATYGILPENIKMLLTNKQADGIIGYDFFNNFKIMLDLRHNRLRFKRHTLN